MKSALLKAIFLRFFLIVIFVSFTTTSVSAKTKSSGDSGSTSDGSQANSKSGSGKGQGSDSSQSPSAQGITSGSLAIESTMLAYMALSEDAKAIAKAIRLRVQGQNVIVATPADLTGVLQWRIVMAQGGLLHDRAIKLFGALPKVPPFFASAPKNVAALGGGPFVASPSDVATLIQTVASIFS
jgi:hypothetical protein